MPPEQAETLVKTILSSVDIDKTGQIDYNGW
jgi:hypothetical protein